MGRGGQQIRQNLASIGVCVRPDIIQHLIIYLAWISVPSAFCQTIPSSNPSSTATSQASRAVPTQVTPPPEPLPKRIFGIIPNYRSHSSLKDSIPLTPRQKFRLAARDSFDPGTFLLAGAFAGIGQASNSTPSYGQGM